MEKKITLGDFLTDDQINKAIKLNDVDSICDSIVKPNMTTINSRLGQENDPKYLAYMIKYVIDRLG